MKTSIRELYVLGIVALGLGFPLIAMVRHNVFFPARRKRTVAEGPPVSGPMISRGQVRTIAVVLGIFIGLSISLTLSGLDAYAAFDLPCQLVGALIIAMAMHNMYRGKLYIARGRMQEISVLARGDDPKKFLAEVVFELVMGASFLFFESYVQVRVVLSHFS